MDKNKIKKAVRMILEGVGENADREDLKKTPERVADMYAEIFSGISKDPLGYLCIRIRRVGPRELV